MKLKNKKTGEIIILIDHIFDNYKNLAELSEEWEDYEEPKCAWIISRYTIEKLHRDLTPICEGCKAIGNYFETKEEAEKAVEKLKAWKRLKDKGFINEQVFSMNLNWCNPDDDDWKAFKLLFGGEE